MGGSGNGASYRPSLQDSAGSSDLPRGPHCPPLGFLLRVLAADAFCLPFSPLEFPLHSSSAAIPSISLFPFCFCLLFYSFPKLSKSWEKVRGLQGMEGSWKRVENKSVHTPEAMVTTSCYSREVIKGPCRKMSLCLGSAYGGLVATEVGRHVTTSVSVLWTLGCSK